MSQKSKSQKHGSVVGPSDTAEARAAFGSSEESEAGEAMLYRSPSAATAHENLMGLYELGFVDKTTMAEFDASCLVPVADLSPPDIKALREREKVSQAVLARYLGVATATLGQWERGLRKPDGPALKLLSLIERHGLDYIR